MVTGGELMLICVEVMVTGYSWSSRPGDYVVVRSFLTTGGHHIT